MAWGPAGITAVQLPEPTPEGTRQRLLRNLPDRPELGAGEKRGRQDLRRGVLPDTTLSCVIYRYVKPE